MTLTPDTHNTPESMDAFWASVDDGYFEDREWFSIFVVEFARPLFSTPENLFEVMDFGCGGGQLMEFIWGNWPWVTIRGIDYSVEAIAKAEELLRPVHYKAFYIQDLSQESRVLRENIVGVGFCIQTLEHIQDYQKALYQMMRWIKPGGSLILTVPNADNWPGHHNQWTPETFRELLETYGEVAECMTFGRNEGDNTNILARVVKI